MIGACAFGITYMVEKFTLLKVANEPHCTKKELRTWWLHVTCWGSLESRCWIDAKHHSLTVLQTEEFT